MTTPRYEYSYRLDRIVTLRDPGPTTGVDIYGHPLYGPATERRVWAGRMDYSARDETSITVDRSITLDRTRWVVRAGVDVSDETIIVDDAGKEWAVDGISERGRARYLELAARSVG